MTPEVSVSPPVAWGAELVEELVLGAPCLVFSNRHRSVTGLFADARRFPDRPYLVQGGRRVTFAEHERLVATAVGLLRRNGVKKGSPVLLFGVNSVEWVVAYWAILAAGAVVVLGNAWWSEDEVGHAVTSIEPVLVVGDEARLARLPAGLPVLSFSALAELLGDESSDPYDDAPGSASEDDPAVVVFTSGTTGLPKGAVLSHRAIVSTLQALLERTRRLPAADSQPPAPSSSLLSLPMFHVGGLQQIITPMVTGGSIVFSEGRFDPQRIVAQILADGIRVWSAVPTMVTRVMDYLEQNAHPPLVTLHTLGLGGAPVPQELRERVLTWFPSVTRGLAVTYGLSEACGVVATGAGEEVRVRPGCVGRPLATSTVSIAAPDEAGTGEILVRSPSLMLGYWSRPEGADWPVTWDPGPIGPDRWLATGDIGRLDQDGFLFVTDRSKDIVIRGGENIATPHVEGRLSSHSAVAEVAVLGLPHPSLGEELGAVVVLHPGQDVSGEDLGAFARETLAHFEVPSKWWFHPGPLPQNATGKVLKRTLRHEWVERGQAL
ncbi:class I adenylate-forming enzyme family protein [Nocardioides sp. LS1]|uniref:class I adenylate-forming enzyme family protein n=1 Tax=Nocardioides sp. LS1 TaxID=1027620 RepID=UPI000F61EDCE|nr:class I adenylate-forming enzyme family protein [Nocardioides sp. LS1]GCD90141.1 fatty acid--CoA ligase [Nocardioides sp. LS1]